jgi:aspartate aminotransferase-like enzyme
MKQRLMTPGPTPVPEDTLLEMAKPVFYHRSAQCRQLLADVTEDLQYVFCTKNPVLTLTCSGTGGMEAAIASSLPTGSKAICAIAGRWGERWRNICKALGVEVVSVVSPYGQPVAPDAVAAALAEHPHAIAVCATLSETATGVRNDIAAIGKITAATPAILLVDSISGLGVVECRTDGWGVDINVTGSQKALMLPPGLAFVSVSDKAWKRIDANPQARAFYFDLKRYRDNLKNFDTPFTPANTLLRALKVSLKRLRDEGIENVWARQARIAAATRTAIAAMGLELFATQPADGLTVFKVPEGIDGAALVSQVEKRYGVRLAGGQDTLKGKIVRIGHMGHIDQWDVLATIASLELTLLEMGHELEPGMGVAAFQKALARQLPQPVAHKEAEHAASANR